VSQARVVFRNTAVLGTARIIERASGLVLALLITRHLGADGLGVYATAVAYFGLIGSAGESGTTNLLIRELSRDRARTASYVSHTGVMALALSLFVMAIAWIVIPYLHYSADLQHSLQLIVLAVAPGTLNTIQEAVFVAHQRVQYETITTFAASCVLVVGSFALLERGHGVVSLVALFVCLEYAVTVIYFVIINYKIAKLRLEFRRATAAEILRELKGFAGSSLLGGIFARPEILILSLVGTEAQVGYLSGATRIVDLFQFLPQVYMTNVFPLLSRSYHERDGRAERIQHIAIRHLMAIAFPISVGLFFAAEKIISAFYGSDFDPAVILLRILSFNVLLYCLHAVLWRVLAARGEQGLVFRIQLVTTSTRLAAGIGLISLFKTVGAAVTIPLAFFLQVSLFVRAVRRDGTRLPLVHLTWRFAAAAGLMGGVVFVLDRTAPLSVIVPTAAGAYIIFVAVLRAFSPREVEFFKNLLPSIPLRSGRSG
jgi:O-antigen/teichoic acid export membrane protein